MSGNAGRNFGKSIMAKSDALPPLLDVLKDLMVWFENEKIKGIVIEGIAASLLGRPRVTHDVDVLVQLDEKHWPDFLSRAARYNFLPRINEALKFAEKSRVLLLQHKPTHINVDIAFAALPFEEQSILNSIKFEIEGITLRLPSPEDLIIMKAVAARPKDLIDIDAIIDANPDLKYKRIRGLVREFAEALNMPDLFEELDKILTKKRK
ncbi:MAG: hypothetical protein D6813_04920 [Calditrichaeota bacterium]|nr:MAG: hypothetical protein D6813_04920 [Calditrichota bacterium]